MKPSALVRTLTSVGWKPVPLKKAGPYTPIHFKHQIFFFSKFTLEEAYNVSKPWITIREIVSDAIFILPRLQENGLKF